MSKGGSAVGFTRHCTKVVLCVGGKYSEATVFNVKKCVMGTKQTPRPLMQKSKIRTSLSLASLDFISNICEPFALKFHWLRNFAEF